MHRHLVIGGVLSAVFATAVPAAAAELKDGSIHNKLDVLAEKQDRILELLDQMKEELSVIKIRASQS